MLRRKGVINMASVDQVYQEIRSRALAQFNCQCAAEHLGHWPKEQEAMDYFLETPYGVRDALKELGAEEPFANFKERNGS